MGMHDGAVCKKLSAQLPTKLNNWSTQHLSLLQAFAAADVRWIKKHSGGPALWKQHFGLICLEGGG